MIRLIIILLTFCLGCHVMAQGSLDKIELKDGSKLFGSVLSWDLTTELVLKLENGGEARIPSASVKKVVQADRTGPSQGYLIEKNRLYGMVQTGALLGRAPWGDVSTGGSFHLQGYYGVRPSLGVGLGIGSELYLPGNERDITSYPVYATLQYTPSQKFTAGLMAGYSFVGKGQGYGINVNYIDATGGIYTALQVQYALGRHFAIVTGLQTSAKKREWVQSWDERNRGYDRFNHYRIAIGISYRL